LNMKPWQNSSVGRARYRLVRARHLAQGHDTKVVSILVRDLSDVSEIRLEALKGKAWISVPLVAHHLGTASARRDPALTA
jgi:hypothetical protein